MPFPISKKLFAPPCLNTGGDTDLLPLWKAPVNFTISPN